MIPFADLDIRPEDIAAVCETLSSGWLTTGERCRELERELAELIGVSYVLVTSSLTAAVAPLLASLFPVALPRKAVFPSWTFAAVPLEFERMGIAVELADVDPETLMLPVRSYDAEIIVPTHLFGNQCDLQALKRANPGATIIDDAAHLAPGPRPLEGVAASLYSFYATKPLPTGEGGAAALNCGEEVAERFRAARLHGIVQRTSASRAASALPPYDVVAGGWKANMGEMTAALGLSQLPRVAEGSRLRRAVTDRYAEALPAFGVHPIAHQPGSSCHIAAARLDDRWDRNLLMAALAARGIGTSVHFTPLYRLTHWAETLFGTDPATFIESGEAARLFPVSEAHADRMISLPVSRTMRPGDVEEVIGAIAGLAGAVREKAFA